MTWNRVKHKGESQSKWSLKFFFILLLVNQSVREEYINMKTGGAGGLAKLYRPTCNIDTGVKRLAYSI